MRNSIIIGTVLSLILMLTSCKKDSASSSELTISSLSPASITAGSPAFDLTVTGANFVSGQSIVTWNGTQRPTTFISSTQLKAAITAADVSTAGSAAVSVATGVKVSNSLTFTINTYHPRLIFKYKMDSTQARLDNFGNASTLPSGHAGQSPMFHIMASHYIELAQNANTALGAGAVLYKTATTTAGGASAIDFTQEAKGNTGDIIYSVELDSVPAGSYQYLRVSLAYQNYDVTFRVDTTLYYNSVAVPIHQDFPCTIASFVGYNTFLSSYVINTQSVTVNGNKLQGYWGAEEKIDLPAYGYSQVYTQTGQAASTTVVNPLFATSPIPAGSCVVTAAFQSGSLVITGNETQDIVVTVGLSTNKSFEWQDLNGNGKWDPLSGENVVDMGVRGMLPTIGH